MLNAVLWRTIYRAVFGSRSLTPRATSWPISLLPYLLFRDLTEEIWTPLLQTPTRHEFRLPYPLIHSREGNFWRKIQTTELPDSGLGSGEGRIAGSLNEIPAVPDRQKMCADGIFKLNSHISAAGCHAVHSPPFPTLSWISINTPC
jgi:hypothetical protein